MVSNDFIITNKQATGFMSFETNDTERMVILNNGDVGIGDTSPSYKLDVNGDINCTGNFRVNGTVFSGGSS